MVSSIVMAAIAFYAVGVGLVGGHLGTTLAAPDGASVLPPFLTVSVSLKMSFADATLILFASVLLRTVRREPPAVGGEERTASPGFGEAVILIVYSTLMMMAIILALCVSVHVFCQVMLA